MHPRSVQTGFQELSIERKKAYIGFEQFQEEQDNEMLKSDYSGNTKFNSSSPYPINNASSFDYPIIPSKTHSTSSSLSKSSDNANLISRRLCTPILSAIYTEIVTIWFKEKWLRFTDNHKETFLTLNSEITGFLTVQMAINQESFIDNRLPLLYLPECLLIRTEPNNKSLLLPNATISLEHLFERKRRSNENLSQGKLIAIIYKSDETNSNSMFYKHSLRNHWYAFFNDPTTPSQSYSNMLSNNEQAQLDSIIEQTNSTYFNYSSQLPYPLTFLKNHPITYVYLIERINDKN